MVQLMTTIQQAAVDHCPPGQAVANIPNSVLTAKVCNASVVKVHSATVAEAAKWVLSMGVVGYPDDFFQWHAAHVNPTEITVTPTFLDSMCTAIPKKNPTHQIEHAGNSPQQHFCGRTQIATHARQRQVCDWT